MYKTKEKLEQVKKVKQQISDCVFKAFEEGKVLNKGYIQSKVKIGRQLMNPEIRDYVKKILEVSHKDFQ
ncbi:hypothetical protein [Lysinibacillus sp. ZYM-1]|uniref:hypothetical protein n=1 Tax=Lysinibacillus sp. ZYM-1 TaxID=1681184 RepID=UPI0006CE741D|nr:hypothetical protein [Lysinibacillus sp. ZYM-1]KPN96435.1 hypothetical protein AO843_16900 [Lysinibacillus sp. ZYM-1]